MVLRRAGFDARSAVHFVEFAEMGSKLEPDVIVLCHTLPQKDAEEALALVRSRWPRAKQLVLTAGSQGYRNGNVSDVMEAADGPEQLISHVAQLVQHSDRPQPSA